MVVIDLEGIKLASINNKYISRKYILSKPYREFKKLIIDNCTKVQIKPPYFVTMEFETYKDLDAPIKPCLDALEDAGVIDNDRNVLGLHVIKTPTKRGKKENIKISIETM